MNDHSPHSPSGRRDGLADHRGDDASRELEQALATLRPSAGAIDRDRLMFLAGRATIERAVVERSCAGGMLLSKWMWPGATAISTLAATVLGLLLAISHRPLVVHEPVYAHEPAYIAPRHTMPPGPQPGGLPGTMLDQMSPDPMTAGERTVMTDGDNEEPAWLGIARVDYVPRTTLPPASYVQKRQVALELGVEALGSGAAAGWAEHPIAYRDGLGDIVRGMD